jgi:hypothetical protein
MNGNWLMKLVSPFGYRHPQVIAGVRIVVGIWLLVLTAALYGSGRGGWWGVLLLSGAAACFYLAYRLPRLISARKQSANAA